MVDHKPNNEHDDEHTLTSLLDYVEGIESEIHQNSSNRKVDHIIAENFSPDFQVEENETPLNLASFKTFLNSFRQKFTVVKITDRRPVVHKDDAQGRGGIVGFATSWIFKQKSDGKLLGGDTIEIFTVTCFPEAGEPWKGRRLITNAQAAIGDLTPIKVPKTTAKRGEGRKNGVVSGRVSKTKKRSKAV